MAEKAAETFEANEELPKLLMSAEEENGVRIMPVILSPCRFLETPSLARFQAANPPSKPLMGMREVDQEYVLYSLSKDIEDILSGDK